MRFVEQIWLYKLIYQQNFQRLVSDFNTECVRKTFHLNCFSKSHKDSLITLEQEPTQKFWGHIQKERKILSLIKLLLTLTNCSWVTEKWTNILYKDFFDIGYYYRFRQNSGSIVVYTICLIMSVLQSFSHYVQIHSFGYSFITIKVVPKYSIKRMTWKESRQVVIKIHIDISETSDRASNLNGSLDSCLIHHLDTFLINKFNHGNTSW